MSASVSEWVRERESMRVSESESAIETAREILRVRVRECGRVRE